MKLDDSQQLVVDYPFDKNLLVMAGAGSGKTTAVVNRSIKAAKALTGTGKKVLMVTFSNKAANEMRLRVKSLQGVMDGIDFHTFHSLGLALMKADPDIYDLEEGFSILNQTDQHRLIREVFKGYFPKVETDDRDRLNPTKWLNTWSLSRQAGYDTQNPRNKETLTQNLVEKHKLSPAEGIGAYAVLSFYERVKRQSNTVDFDDLVYQPLLKLNQNPDYRERISSQYGHIVLDEAQDTNRIQYELIRFIAHDKSTVTCVGDDDQSIYGWRGADVSNMRRFTKQFNAGYLKMERNYRSTKSIVDAARQLIENNELRLEKSPYSVGEQGQPVGFSASNNSFFMASTIADSIQAGIDNGEPASAFAVLYRTNRMALLLEQAFRARSIPYTVVGGMSLYDRQEVQSVMSALRLGLNPRDVFALKNLAPHIEGLGVTSCNAMSDWILADDSRDIYQLPAKIEGVRSKALEQVKLFASEVVTHLSSTQGVKGFTDWVAEGMLGVVRRERDQIIKDRKAKFLKVFVGEIENEIKNKAAEGEQASWHELALETALRDTSQDDDENKTTGMVTLSTIHRAKGLEYAHVHIAGASDGFLPLAARNSQEMEDDDAEFLHAEEERRLAYVAVTRAKLTCTMHHADEYMFPSQSETTIHAPSHYLAEMGIDTSHALNQRQHHAHSNYDYFNDDSDDIGDAIKQMITVRMGN